MANKRRPKKTRPPYRRYVYKSSFTENENAEETEKVVDNLGNWQDFDTATNSNIRSVYVLTKQNSWSGKVWPRSQFEKVDVLACCLFYGSPAYREQLIREEEQRQAKDRMSLPVEIISLILEFLHWQHGLKPRFLRLSKLLHAIALPIFYRKPILKGDNFYLFVETISASKHVGTFIRDLDLSHVNQSGKNAFVAKLLKRSRPHLHHFTAPQTSFGLGPLMALRGCVQLRSLDLSLVSETLNLDELFVSIRSLEHLTHLSFPRSSIEISDLDSVRWPPQLQYLRVAGGISDDFLIKSQFPPNIRHMDFAHCPKVMHAGFQHLLLEFGRNLQSLRIQFPMPGLHANSLDSIFELCPNLLTLEVTVDYLSSEFFDVQNLAQTPYPRPLKNLHIDSSGMLGTTDRLDPLDLACALDEQRLPFLKNVRCTAKLGWNPANDDVSFIATELEERGGGLYIGY